jgi:hypothetical protein
MRRIWKYKLEITDKQEIWMPEGAKILHVDNQYGDLCLWTLVDDEQNNEERTLIIVGTGRRVPDYPTNFIGTVVIESFVWHVFERIQGCS